VGVVILRAPDIAVRHHGGGSGWTRQGLLVASVFENRFETFVRTCPDADGAPAGGCEATLARAFAQPHDAHTGAEALLGMRPRGQNGCDHLGGGLTRLRGPKHEPLGRPCGRGLVGCGHVDGHRAVTPFAGRTLMAGHPCALVEDFDDLRTETDLELLLDQSVGHGVIVAVDFHVVVDVDAHQFPLGILLGLGGQWSESGTVKGLEHALA